MTLREKFIRDQKISAARHLAAIRKQVRSGNHPESFSMPVGLQFELTAKCNMTCRHCYNMSSAERRDAMRLEDWKDVVRDVVAHGGIFQCILSGGEPLLMGDGLFEIMDPLHDDGTGFILLTNGFLVDAALVRKMRKFDWYWVQVSIDHLLEAEHDDFRRKKDSWRHAVNAAMLFSDAGLPLRISHCMTPKSIDYFPEFADFCHSLGASTIVCGEIMLSGRVDRNRDLLMDDADYERLHAAVAAAQKAWAGRMSIELSATEAVEIRRHQKMPNTSAIIRPNGTVRLDCIAPFTIGNVLERPLSAIWKEKGASCWRDPRIAQYLHDLENSGRNIGHINHVTEDIAL